MPIGTIPKQRVLSDGRIRVTSTGAIRVISETYSTIIYYVGFLGRAFNVEFGGKIGDVKFSPKSGTIQLEE